eukprot:scaffold114068_cov19-Tisochrysis_lutea.AAC.1
MGLIHVARMACPRNDDLRALRAFWSLAEARVRLQCHKAPELRPASLPRCIQACLLSSFPASF